MNVKKRVLCNHIDNYKKNCVSIFNKKTLKIIENIESGKNLLAAKNAQDLFKKLLI